MNTALEYLAEEATNAFWEVIVRRFPQAKFGDLSPLTTLAFRQSAEHAIEEWVTFNVSRKAASRLHKKATEDEVRRALR